MPQGFKLQDRSVHRISASVLLAGGEMYLRLALSIFPQDSLPNKVKEC